MEGVPVGSLLLQTNGANNTSQSKLNLYSSDSSVKLTADSSGDVNLQVNSVTAASGAPTSAGTAGTTGQMIYFGGLLYFCSVTGVAGSATWNKLTMAAV
jgi:hypothetical protein